MKNQVSSEEARKPRSKRNHPVWGPVITALQDAALTPKDMLQTKDVPEGLTSQMISQYKNGNIFPDLRHLPWLSLAIGREPTYLAQLLGAVPDTTHLLEEHTEALRRFQYLTAEIASMERRLQANSESRVANIVMSALRTGHWAVAAWPASEGPADCKVHVSDRLDFRRTDGGEESPEALAADLGDLVPIGAMVKHPPKPRWSSNPLPGLALSLQPTLDWRSPSAPFPHSRLHSVAVVAHTVQSWASDTASIVATFLGYGLESTRDLKVRIYGAPRHPSKKTPGGDNVTRLRAELHESFLQTPPRRYVWYHFGEGNAAKHFLPSIGAQQPWPHAVLVVRLRESDALLEAASMGNSDPEARLEHLINVRDHTDQSANLLQTNLFHQIAVDTPPQDIAPPDVRNWKRSTALHNASKIVEYALDNELLDQDRVKRVMEEILNLGTRDERTLVRWAIQHNRLIYR